MSRSFDRCGVGIGRAAAALLLALALSACVDPLTDNQLACAQRVLRDFPAGGQFSRYVEPESTNDDVILTGNYVIVGVGFINLNYKAQCSFAGSKMTSFRWIDRPGN
jgi:hypothetical protein